MLLETRPVDVAPVRADTRIIVALISTGLAIGILLAVFISLFVNVPTGYDSLFGLSPASVTLFRQLWWYPTVSLDSHGFALAASAVIFLLWVTYVVASMSLRDDRWTRSHRHLVLVIAVFAVVFNVALFLFMPPVLSADVYHYGLFGRMVAFYHLNPYVTSDLAIKGDPLWGFAFWKDMTTHYGPVWTLISAVVAWGSAQSTVSTVLAFKGLAASFNLLNCGLVFLLARRLGAGNGARSLLLYAWNPLILIETAGSGHNEVVMMTFALVGLLLFVRGQLIRGTIALALSVLVTYLTAILAFFVVVSLLASSTTWRRAGMLVARLGGAAAAVVVTLYAPFRTGVGMFGRVVAVGSPFKTPVRVALREVAARLVATNGANLDVARVAVEPYVILGLHLVFLVLVLLLARGLLAGGITAPSGRWSQVLDRWGIASLVYVAVVYGWNLPFYLIIPMSTVSIGPASRTNERLNAACTGLGIAWMLLYGLLFKVG